MFRRKVLPSYSVYWILTRWMLRAYNSASTCTKFGHSEDVGSMLNPIVRTKKMQPCSRIYTFVKPEAAITVFELLMMGGVSPETCWGIKKHWNNKFYYTVASCWFFLWDLYYDARIHEHQDSMLLCNAETNVINLHCVITHKAIIWVTSAATAWILTIMSSRLPVSVSMWIFHDRPGSTLH